jgi:enterochelin esterase-like enzyme
MPFRRPRGMAVVGAAGCAVTALAVAAVAVAQTTPANPPAAAAAPAAPPRDEPPPIDHATLRRALEGKAAGKQAADVVDKVRKWFGAEALKNGTAVKAEGLEAAWAVEAEGAKAVTAQSIDGFYRQKLERIGDSWVWAAVATVSDGSAFRFSYNVDDRRIGGGQAEFFTIPADGLAQPGVPRGKVIPQKKWKSKIFAGTERDWWIYVPAQYRASKPAAVMVFQDGGNHYVKQVPIYFDNLIHKGDMPVTVGVFINPGVFADGKRNRSFEYDTLSDQYARFIIEEILPEVEKTAKLRKDPESRAIGGLSSGAICAFTVAWERPDQFRKVLSWIGSYTNIAAGASLREGGHNYAALIRKVPRKPIRVFLQDGEQDLDGEAGSWTIANRQIERSFAYASWDYRMVWGRGFHSPKHGYSILGESLRWLWRDHKNPPPSAPTPAPAPARTASTAP